jgi:hydrogenase-4 component F
MLLPLILIPLIASLLLLIPWKDRKIINILNCAGTLLLFVTALYNIGILLEKGTIKPGYLNGIFYLDHFNGLILLVTTLVSLLISFYSVSYMNEELKHNIVTLKNLRLFYFLLHAFIFTMVLTTIVQNLGVMWIAIEATTLASAFLVGFYKKEKSVEASWKYLIICSVGIAFAMLGITLIYYSSTTQMGHSFQALNWSFLIDNADKLQGNVLKFAFIFIFVGFGTKVGLAPMHTWLPDAHSQAPSPISALLSGVLLNTAMYGIMRVTTVVNVNLGDKSYTGNVLIVFGLLSMFTAAVFILVQQDIKRLLAYSSIENMGIIALGFGIASPLAVFAALYHTINHSLTKSMLFAASGNVYIKYGTKKIRKIRGILKTMPVTGTVFLLGLFAITGMPPFSIFTSEFGILSAAAGERKYLSLILAIVFLVMVFAGVAVRMLKMFYGAPGREMPAGEPDKLSPVILVIFIILIAITGFYIPGPLNQLLSGARDIITAVK